MQEEKTIFEIVKSKWERNIGDSFLLIFRSLSWDHFESIKTYKYFILNVSFNNEH